MKIDYHKLDQLIRKTLEAHKSEDLSLVQAVGAISHFIAAVAKGKTTDVTDWIDDPVVFDRWLNDIKSGSLL